MINVTYIDVCSGAGLLKSIQALKNIVREDIEMTILEVNSLKKIYTTRLGSNKVVA